MRKIFLNKIKIIKNKKNFIKKIYKLKLNKLKLFFNLKLNKNFYINEFKFYQEYLQNIDYNTNTISTYITDFLNYKFNSGKFHTFDSYLTSIELIDYSYLKKNFNLKYKYSMLMYFIPFLLKNGKKLYTINVTLKSISNIYNNLNYSNTTNFNEYTFVAQFKHYLNTADGAYNLNFLLYWIINIYKPVFDIKAFNAPKIHKKKSDKSTIFKILYLSEKDRIKTAYKHIATNIKNDNSSKFNSRVNSTFLDILLNYKNSYLCVRKMYIYEQVMDL